MMLCGVVVFSNCACIWINCSRRLLPLAFDAVADVVVPDELDDEGALVIDTLDPSA